MSAPRYRRLRRRASDIVSTDQLALNRRAPAFISRGPLVRQYGTSRSYILSRLRAQKLGYLADAIENGRMSAHGVARELGWITGRVALGTGSPNQSKRRRHQFRTLLREVRPDGRR